MDKLCCTKICNTNTGAWTLATLHFSDREKISQRTSYLTGLEQTLVSLVIAPLYRFLLSKGDSVVPDVSARCPMILSTTSSSGDSECLHIQLGVAQGLCSNSHPFTLIQSCVFDVRVCMLSFMFV